MPLPFGEYKLLARIGQGGMCDVLLAMKGARGIDFTKLVVIKKLRPEFVQDVDFVSMFLDEARIAARLNHPNVIHTLDVGQVDEDFFLAMEFLDGQPLNRIAAQARKMPLPMQLAVLSDVLTGVHYAHELRDYDGAQLHIVHRDVTPHNIFVTYDGQVKVTDFGIAKAAGRATQTRHGVVKGKVNYMAPEQMASTHLLDRRVDIFAVGIMLYEAAAGARMWAEVPSAEVVRALVAGKHPRSPRERNPDVDDELDRICRKALARAPADRYPTADAFREDLDALLARQGSRPSNRQIGNFIAEVFADQRQRALAILDTQVSEVLEAKKSMTSISFGTGEPVEPEIEIETALLAASTTAEPTKPTITAPQQERPAGRAPRFVVLSAVAIVSLAFALLGAWRLARYRAIASSPQAASESEMVTLTLRATPLETIFRVDDGPLLDNPYIARLPMDRRAHAVRASAPGFDDKVEQVVFDHDVSVRFSLVRGTPKE